MKQYRLARLTILISISALVMFFLSACDGHKPGEGSKPNQDQKDLIRYYLQMKEAGLKKDIMTFTDMRDSLTHVKVKMYFSNWGRVINGRKISDWAYNWPDVAGLPILEDSTYGEWRRLIFKMPDVKDKEGRVKAVYPMIIFRNNNGTWKVSNASRKSSYYKTIDGDTIMFDDFMYHPFFRLPPTFEDLLKLPGDSSLQNIERRPVGALDSIAIPSGKK